MTKSQGWYALGVLWLIFLNGIDETKASAGGAILASAALSLCLLYTSDAADEGLGVLHSWILDE